jgi:type I restriction enzyme S subunit
MSNEWETVELAAVSAINYGYTESASSEPVGPRFLRITDIQDDRVDWDAVPYCKIDISDLPKFRLASGDIVFARTGATTGKSFLVEEPPEAVFASYLIRLRLLHENLMPQFLLMYFQTADYWQSIKEGSSGSAQGGFNATKLGALKIPLPPLPEQQRIVALLDEAFAGLATAKANAERNLQNARAIFESHLQSVFSQRGEGWVETTLGEVCEMYQPKTIGLKDLVSDGQYPVFGANGIIGQYDKFNHEEPQLLITCRGATCGSVNISEPFSWITGNAMVVRPLGESLDLGYLEFAFRGGINTSEAITGSAQPQITRTNLSPLPISFPFSVDEQQRLATSFRSLAAETQHLTRLYERKLAALEELKKSLLHQAFNGEL